MSDAVENKPKVATVTFTMDGNEYTVPKGTTVLEAAKMNGINIPTFCWHPKLKSVGACRMCYVEVEKMPKLQVSCMLEAMDGMIVHTNSDQVKQGRKAVIEFILLNHPLDCPTCDKGGECDLQNLTFAHGIDDTRYDFTKARFVDEGMSTTFDDKKIGPEIVLNRNRCILCYKCVRANKEAFGEYDLGAYERGNITEINSAPGEEVDNPFSGNLVEICPVGALTNSDWRYKIRVWNTKTTPSVCPFTSSGTNISFYKEDHQNKIFRVTSRRNDDIDDGWIADITRYGYQIIGSEDRLKKPLIKKDGKHVETTWEEAVSVISKHFSEIKEKMGSVCIGGLVAPHLDNRTLFSFSKLMRVVFKSNNLDFRGDYRMLPAEPDTAFGLLRSQSFSIKDIDDSDVILVVGSDLTHEHHNEYLRVRKAATTNNASVYMVNPYETKASDVSNLEVVYKPGADEAVILGICAAACEEELVDKAEADKLLAKISPNKLEDLSKLASVEADDLKLIAHALNEGRKISVIAGELVTKSKERDLISSALMNLNKLFDINKNGQIAILARYANSRGAEKLGLLPKPVKAVSDKLKEVWSEYPDAAANTTDAMMALSKKEEIKGAFILGANPLMLYPDRDFVKEALDKLEFLVISDMFESELTDMADVVLPLAGWAEYSGDYINLEGKLQHGEQAVKAVGQAKPGYEIVNLIAKSFDNNKFENDLLDKEINDTLNVKTTLELPTEYLETKIESSEETDTDGTYPCYIVDDSHHSGHLTEKAQSLLNFCSEAYLEISPDLASKLDVKNGELIRVESEVGKVILKLKISDILESDVVLIPRNFSTTPVNSLFMRKKRVDRVKLTKVED